MATFVTVGGAPLWNFWAGLLRADPLPSDSPLPSASSSVDVTPSGSPLASSSSSGPSSAGTSSVAVEPSGLESDVHTITGQLEVITLGLAVLVVAVIVTMFRRG